MASESSANAGSNVLSGNGASPETLSRAESRKDDRDEGRSGVVGREVRVRDVDRARFVLESRFELGMAGMRRVAWLERWLCRGSFSVAGIV
jgi:hypothetical protein